MPRLNNEEMQAVAIETMGAAPDESGAADLIWEKGAMNIAAEPEDMKTAFKRIKKIPGYRWVMINREDLFAANTLSLGSKAGMITPDGTVLKAADIPRKKV